MKELNIVIGENISKYRKLNNMTQIELAEKINYSDKSVSKWEKGDGVPDIFVLKTLADIFGVTVNDIITEQKEIVPVPNEKRNKRNIIILLSVILVWLVAVVIFVLTKWINPSLRSWLVFLYAVDISFIVAFVLGTIWLKKLYKILFCSGIAWSILISITVTMANIQRAWLICFIGIPLQIMILLWYIFIRKDKE